MEGIIPDGNRRERCVELKLKMWNKNNTAVEIAKEMSHGATFT